MNDTGRSHQSPDADGPRNTARVRGERFYRALLLVYPPSFRRRYRDRLVDAFRRQRSEHAAAGGGALSFWLGIASDTAASAVRLYGAGIIAPFGPMRGGVARPGRRKGPVLAEILANVRYAWRGLRRNPSFALAALATITLAVGASTAVFSVADVALIRALPFEEADRLYYVAETHPEQLGGGVVAPQTLRDWRRLTTAFEGFAASSFNSRVYRHGERAEVLTVADVNGTFFEVLGRGPQVGRVFNAGDEARGEWLAVLSDAFWRSRFGGSPDAIGRTLALDDRVYTIVGVMPHEFGVPDDDVPVWTLESWADDTGRSGRYLAVVGRLGRGRTVAQAESELNAIAARLAEAFPTSNEGWGVTVTPLRDVLVGAAAAPLRLIAASVALLLLVASLNVAGLMLARTAARRREIAVRRALGGARQITRLLATESGLIAAIGGLLGVGLANLLVNALVANPPVEVPLIETVSVDGRALGFALAAVAVTGLLFGFVAAWHSSRARGGEMETLRAAAGTEPRRGSVEARARSVLVVAEIALAAVLVIGAALLLRSLLGLNAVDPGFEVEGRVAARVFLDGAAYQDPGRRSVWVRDVEDAVAGLPGVRAVGTVSVLPMDPVGVNFDLPYRAPSAAELPVEALPQAEFRVASGRIFDAMGIEIVQGRTFLASDDESSRRVVVLNETLAAQAFPDRSPIGQRITLYWDENEYEVIGVVGDTRQAGLDAARTPQLYVHFPQLSLHFGSTNVVAATDGDATALLRAVEDAVLEVDPGQPAHSVIELESLVADSIARERFATMLLTGLAALSLILAALGLYGLVSFVVRQRTRELAIRMALGARRANAVGTVMRHSVLLALAGAGIGVIGARAAARLVESLLFEVSPADPLTYVLVPTTLVAVAMLAAARPALAAANADPLAALRQE